MNLCDDNRIITIEKAKQALIKGTNIENSPEEMKVLDNILFRCWQMGWLDRYDPQMPSNTSNALEALDSVNATQSNALDCISRAKAIEALTKDKKALEHIINEMSGYEKEFDRLVGQRNQVDYDIYEIKQLPPALGTNLAEVGTDCISRQAAISAICNACGKIDCDKMDKCEKLQLSSANTSETPNSSDTISRQAVLSKFEPWLKVDGYNEGERNILKAILYELKFGKFATDTNVGRTDTISRAKAIEALDKRFDSIPMEQTSEILMLRKDLRDLPPAQPESDPSQIAAQIIHDAIDNTTFAEEAYPGIKEQLHRSVEEWEKLQPVFTEIAEEYRKACEISYINKPLAYALHEVWKKHDRRDTKRNE